MTINTIKAKQWSRVFACQLLAATSFSAFAEDQELHLMPWYAGVGLGMNDYEHEFPIANNRDDSAFAWDIFGGYRLGEYYAVELGYRDLGKAKWDGISNGANDAHVKGVSLGLVGRIPVTNQWHVLLEGGALRYWLKSHNQGTSGAYISGNGYAPYAGIGTSWQFDQNLEFAVKYRRYDQMDDNRFGVIDLDSNYWGLSASYRFGYFLPKAVQPETILPTPQDTDKDGVMDNQDMCPDSPQEFAVDAQGCTLKEEVMQTLAIDAKFANNSSVITESSLAEIAVLAEFMQQYPRSSVIINGYASNVGPANYNMMLSEKRAQAVATALVNQFGIDSSRVSSQGFGETKPLIEGTSPEANAANRRIEAEVTVVDIQSIQR